MFLTLTPARIYRPKSLTGAKDLTKNAEVVAGTGSSAFLSMKPDVGMVGRLWKQHS